MEIVNTLKNVDILSWVIIFTLIMVAIGLYIKRASPYVKDIITNAIIEAENHFNSGEGQQKLHFAVTTIRGKLPVILRIFITHRMLVTMIETTLNKISDSFELNKKVDIKGNDSIVYRKIDIDEVNKTTSLEMDTRPINVVNTSKDSDVEVYANVKAKTDWRDNTETSVEVGIKKKL